MREVVAELASALGRRTPRWRVPAAWARWGSDVASFLTANRGPAATLYVSITKWLADDLFDGGKFEQTFDFRAEVPLVEGLRREVAWYRGLSDR